MWIVRLALRRPYTIAVMALLILTMGILSASRMIVDIFPAIDIPVVMVVWSYDGLTAEDMERRVVLLSERAYSTTVNGIQRLESDSISGLGLVKVYFQPGSDIGAAISQISAVSSTILRSMPPGMQPPNIIQLNASNVAVAQLTMSSDTMREEEIFDYGLNFVRVRLFTIPGLSCPAPYGGKIRQIMVDLDPDALGARGLSPADVVSSLQSSNVIMPAGTARMGSREYNVITNSSPSLIDQFNEIPVKVVGDAAVYLGDVARVSDSFAEQNNIVRVNGKRATYLAILKHSEASTLAVVDAAKATLPLIREAAPEGLEIKVDFDQSVFVRAAIEGVVREAILSSILVSLMIFIFLGSWRSMVIICISIPLAIFTAIIGLNLAGESINIMTLGGLALAIGMLVDDATVEVENIHRNRLLGKPLTTAIVATLAICIVFFPVVLLTGPAKFLFTPLALAVVIAMLASYVLSRTLVPTLARMLMMNEPIHEPHGGAAGGDDGAGDGVGWAAAGQKRPNGESQERNGAAIGPAGAARGAGAAGAADAPGDATPADSDPEGGSRGAPGTVAKPGAKQGWLSRTAGRVNQARDDGFERFQNAYGRALETALHRRAFTLFVAGAVFVVSLGLLPVTGTDFFPPVDAGLMKLRFRAPTGTRIEATEAMIAEAEGIIRDLIPLEELETINVMIGVPVSYNIAYTATENVCGMDAEILVSLKKGHRPTVAYQKALRRELAKTFPSASIYFQPADIVSQVLNFGRSSPLSVEIEGSDFARTRQLALRLKESMNEIPGVADPHVNQVLDYPSFQVDVDRTVAAKQGMSQKDVAYSVLTSLSSSVLVAPSFFLNPANNVNYVVAVQTPLSRIDSMQTLLAVPVTPPSAGALLQPGGLPPPTAAPKPPTQVLGDVASVYDRVSVENLSHSSVQRVLQVNAGVEGRDLGSAAADIEKKIAELGKIPAGVRVKLHGQNEVMNESFRSLGLGLILAILLVYFLMVALFQSWLDPFIIMTAIPGAFMGILWMLALTGTTINVESLMGSIMAVGIATSNSILLVNFANDVRMERGLKALEAALEAGRTRLRPVLMTASAMIIGMVPMALGMGEGGEQNAPLGRAVIGGLLMATVVTLFVVPVVYSLLRTKPPPKLMLEERFKAEQRGEAASELSNE